MIRLPKWMQGIFVRLALMSGQQIGLHVAMAVFGLVAVDTIGEAAGVLPVPLLIILLGFVVTAVSLPDSAVVMVLVGVIVWAWLILVHDYATVWAPVAAVALLGLHASAALSTSGPLNATFDALTWRRWLTRTLAVAAVTVAVWLGARLAGGYRLPGSVLLTTLAVLLVGAGALTIRYVGLQRSTR